MIQHLEKGRSQAELAEEGGIIQLYVYSWLRHERLRLRHLARLVQPPPFSSVLRALSRWGLGLLRNLDR